MRSALVLLVLWAAACGAMSYREGEPTDGRCGETGQCEGDRP